MKSSRFIEEPSSKSSSSPGLIIVLAACVPLAFGVAEAWLEDRWLTLMVTLIALCLFCLLWMIVADEAEVEEDNED